MKILRFLNLLAITAAFTFQSCESNTTQTDNMHQGHENGAAEAKEDMAEAREDVLDAYEELKNALVKSDAEKAKTAVADLQAELDKVKPDNLAAADVTTWNNESKKMREHLDKMQAAGSLEEIRKHFKPLSDVLYANIKKFGLANETVYYQHCPMAFNNEGASWLSEESEINNPYLPETMLRCGFTQDTVAIGK